MLSVNEIICRSINLNKVSTTIDVNNQLNDTIGKHIIDAIEPTLKPFDICEHNNILENLNLNDYGITVVMKLF